jgi:hypothetical protein
MDTRQEQVRQDGRGGNSRLAPHGVGTRARRSRAVADGRGLGAALGLGVVATASAGAVLGGCLDRDLRPLVPCVTQGFVESIEQNAVDKVDLLFMIDNSGSMAEEQASVAAELPRLVRILASGDRNLDGVQDFQPVKDLHVGVISSDMGVAGFTVPTCGRNAMFGDDGILINRPSTVISGCATMYPRFLRYQPGITPKTPEEFAQDIACIGVLGTNGCGFEQQLEAVLKAVTPSSDTSITFIGGTLGHGDNPSTNGGFIRPDSVIALVLVTDEEDCSIRNDNPMWVEIFNQASTVYTGDLNLRCFLYKEPQWPVQRYIDGFKKLRRGRESLVVFGAITGVPVDLIGTGTPDYTRILSDPRMIEMVDTTVMGGGRLQTSCNVPMRGIAFPPRRIVEVARGFGENGIIQSICQESYAGALDAIIAKIADALGNVCLPRKLNRTADGTVGCDVIERLPPPGVVPGAPSRCADLVGVEPTELRTNPDGSIDCRVLQVPVVGGAPAAGSGWYYDDFSPSTTMSCGAGGQRIAFTADATPPNGVTVNLECLQRIQGAGGGTATVDIGSFCNPDEASACNATSGGFRLGCDGVTRTCQVPCTNDSDCPTSFICDTRMTGQAYCRNPICTD